MRSRLAFHPRMHIRSQRDFTRAYREGSRARGSVLIVVAVPNGLAWSRLGLSIGKRIWKAATRRNRVRRIFREAFRLTYEDLPAGLDIVLIAAEPRLEPELEQTQRELIKLARKAHRRLLEKSARGAGE